MKSVIRHKNQVPYTQIYRPLLLDDRISFKAKGLMAYLVDKPDGWYFTIEGIVAQCKEGKESIMSGLKELRKFGYLEFIQERDHQGKYCCCEWVLNQMPDIKIISTTTGVSPILDDPDSGEVPTSNTHVSKTQEKEDVCCLSTNKNFSSEDIFRKAIADREDWTTLEIEEAYQVLVNYQGTVHDPQAFVRGTIENILKKKISNNIVKGKKCKKRKYQAPKDLETLHPLKKLQNSTESNTSDQDSTTPAFHKFLSEMRKTH